MMCPLCGQAIEHSEDRRAVYSPTGQLVTYVYDYPGIARVGDGDTWGHSVCVAKVAS